MKLQAVLLATMMASVILAGCTDGGGEDAPVDDVVDTEDYQLGNKGAINGLLVDDRFRPIAGGKVLLQELGQQVTSNENGEFQFLDLEPNTYTVRVTADGHEAAPEKIRVEQGVFSDLSMIARRIINTGGTILTQEFAVFIDCWIPFWTELNCFLDMSLDSKRAGFTADYTAVDDISYVVSEFLFDKPSGYDGDVGVCNGESFSGWYSTTIYGDYGKLTLTNDLGEWENRTEDSYLGGHLREQKFCTVVWPHGQLRETVGVNLGFGISTRAQILQSVFLGEPDVDLESYCVLC